MEDENKDVEEVNMDEIYVDEEQRIIDEKKRRENEIFNKRTEVNAVKQKLIELLEKMQNKPPIMPWSKKALNSKIQIIELELKVKEKELTDLEGEMTGEERLSEMQYDHEDGLFAVNERFENLTREQEELGIAISERATAISEQEALIQQKRELIKQKQAAIKQREEEIAVTTKDIATTGERIEELRIQAEARKKVEIAKNKDIVATDLQIAAKDGKIKAKVTQIRDLNRPQVADSASDKMKKTFVNMRLSRPEGYVPKRADELTPLEVNLKQMREERGELVDRRAKLVEAIEIAIDEEAQTEIAGIEAGIGPKQDEINLKLEEIKQLEEEMKQMEEEVNTLQEEFEKDVEIHNDMQSDFDANMKDLDIIADEAIKLQAEHEENKEAIQKGTDLDATIKSYKQKLGMEAAEEEIEEDEVEYEEDEVEYEEEPETGLTETKPSLWDRIKAKVKEFFVGKVDEDIEYSDEEIEEDGTNGRKSFVESLTVDEDELNSEIIVDEDELAPEIIKDDEEHDERD